MKLNVLRLEGNSEGEEFYICCDEFGILIIFLEKMGRLVR